MSAVRVARSLEFVRAAVPKEVEYAAIFGAAHVPGELGITIDDQGQPSAGK
jgi:hypothetical protein